MLRQIVLALLCLAAAFQCEEVYENVFEVMGYILKHGQNVEWVDGMEEKDNPEASKIQLDVCVTVTKAMASVSKVSQSAISCKLVNLFGHPNYGHLKIDINNTDHGEKPMVVKTFVDQLNTLFKSITDKIKDRSGPLIDRIQYLESTEEGGLSAIHFAVEVSEHGKPNGWRNEYNDQKVLNKLVDLVCPEVTKLAKADKQYAKRDLNCTLSGPSHQMSVGLFRTKFNGQTVLDQATVAERFAKTVIEEGSAYDVSRSHIRFQQHPLQKENGKLQNEEGEATNEDKEDTNAEEENTIEVEPETNTHDDSTEVDDDSANYESEDPDLEKLFE